MSTEEAKEQEEEVKATVDGNEITVKSQILVKEFAELIDMRPNQLIAELMGMNIFASINQNIDLKVAQKIGEKHGYKVVSEKKKKQAERKAAPPPPAPKPEEPEPDAPDELTNRPPVVVFMGHVDHGKTSLLDKIRETKVVTGESGGITQHIGAYTVDAAGGQITFIDTPGHAAFTSMRARGANVTDIAVIIIAADDGIKPQTLEAIQHARAAEVALVIAINKIDVRNANPDRVKQQLQKEGLAPEEWGGETICCEVSAETGDGIDHLLEMINLQAEVLELKANRDKRARGRVIEAQLETGRGPTATLLVQSGTLKVGDPVVCGPHWGKIKALMDSTGKKIKKAGPSYAAKVLGLSDVPSAGAEFVVYPSEKEAKTVSEERLQEARQEDLGEPARSTSLDDLFSATDATDVKELAVVLKADVQGTLEAIKQSLEDIQSEKATLKILLSGVGNITENDVLLASASSALLLGFHVGKEGKVTSVARREEVDVRLYDIIYELIDDVKLAMTGLLEPEQRENIQGRAQIKALFGHGKREKVAGCLVVSGRVFSTSKARVLRDGSEVYSGRIASLKRFQNDASEVRDGQECGILLQNFNKIEEGDIIECFEVESIAQQL